MKRSCLSPCAHRGLEDQTGVVQQVRMREHYAARVAG